MLEPTFGGINLEDIKAPECFEIESRLKATMNIPVFHDDQHGTAIISGAGLLNAMEVVGKPLDKIRIVFNGAGASALATAQHYINLGVKAENTAPLLFGVAGGIPRVFHFQGPWADENVVAGDSSRLRHRLRAALERRVHARIDAHVVLSSAFRRVLVHDVTLREEMG